MEKFDLIVIGSGPGGYVAAIRAAQFGKKVAVIESAALGGICCNWGCIPTKALLKNAEVYDQVKNAKKFGITTDGISVDWQKNIKRSRDVVKKLSRGIEFLFKNSDITWIKAYGKLLDPNTVETTDAEGQINKVSADKIILATGARSKWFDGMKPDGVDILTSKDALVLDKQPESIVIIGAGAIGVEFAYYFNTFGTEVTLIEALPTILPIEDEEISKELERAFKRRKIKMRTDTMVDSVKKAESGVMVKLSNGEKIEAEKALIAVGVKANIETIGLENAGIVTENGWIKTNDFMQTNIENIYAIGDVIGPPWLAHVASAEGMLAIDHLTGKSVTSIDYNQVPGCTYCHPEVASIGLTEKAAKESGIEIRIGRFPFRALGKASAINDSEGFVKMIYDAKSEKMVGCHIIGPGATDLIAQAGLSLQSEMTYKELLKTIYPHPTLSEAIFEAVADSQDEAIHI